MTSSENAKKPHSTCRFGQRIDAADQAGASAVEEGAGTAGRLSFTIVPWRTSLTGLTGAAACQASHRKMPNWLTVPIGFSPSTMNTCRAPLRARKSRIATASTHAEKQGGFFVITSPTHLLQFRCTVKA